MNTSGLPLSTPSVLGCSVDNRDGRARKRRRATSDPNYHAWYRRVQITEPVPPPSLVHDPEFWFEDGSIVLVAHNIGFRVYKRLLSEHSPLFRDLFQMPQPAYASKVEGTPCVVLLDPPEQVRHLLRVLLPTNGNLTYVADLIAFMNFSYADKRMQASQTRGTTIDVRTRRHRATVPQIPDRSPPRTGALAPHGAVHRRL